MYTTKYIIINTTKKFIINPEYILNRYCSLASNTTEKLIYIDVYEMIVAEYKCSRIKDHLIATI